MSLSKPDRMMVPTAKSTTGAPVPLTDPIDHYKCYKVGAAKLNVPGVTITDQFGTITVDIKKPLHLCLPAIKEHEGPLVDPTTALMCYKVNGPPQAVRPDLPDVAGRGALRRTGQAIDEVVAVEPLDLVVHAARLRKGGLALRGQVEDVQAPLVSLSPLEGNPRLVG